MPNLTLSSNLNSSAWTKAVGAAEKPAKMAGLLDNLKTAFNKLPQGLLEMGDVADPEAAADREKALKNEWDKAAGTVAEQCKAIGKLADECLAKFKKDSSAPKTAASAAQNVSKDAAALAKDVSDAGSKAASTLKSLAAKLQAEAKKAEADKKKGGEDDEEALAAEKNEKAFRSKTGNAIKGAMQKLKGPKPPPLRFCAYGVKKEWGVFVGRSSGNSQLALAKRLQGGDSGGRDLRGVITWDPKAKAFVLDLEKGNAGKGDANPMATSMRAYIGYRPKLRLQKAGTVVEDGDEGEADPDDADAGKSVAADEAGKVDPVKAFTARLDALKTKIQEATKGGGEQAKAIQDAVQDAGKLIGRKLGDLAQKKLDDIEVLLSKASKGGGSGKAATVAFDATALTQAVQALSTARQGAASGIQSLADKLVTEYESERDQLAQAQQAAKRLRDLAATLKADFEMLANGLIKASSDKQREQLMAGARKSLQQLKGSLDADALWKEIDGNELDPSMKVVAPLREQIAKAEAALG